MSLFDDDFYTTKLPRRSRWMHNGRSVPAGRFSKEWKLFASGAGAATLLLLFLAIVVNGFGGDREQDQKALPAQASVTSADDYFRWKDDLVVRAVDLVKPAVVSIIAIGKDTGNGQPQTLGIGSGVIFQKSGGKAYIVTNNHVVQSAAQVEVILADGEHRRAQIKGKDLITDLAVVEIDASGIEAYAEFGDSSKLKSGETAIAIGNPLGLGFSQTTTVGVISSPQRKIPISFANNGTYDWEMEVIQTDAAINQGNSGGALVNLDGKVIGINSMKIAVTGVEGLGFAIPSNAVKETVADLIKYGKVPRPFMGITTDALRSYRGASGLNLPDSVKNGLIVMDVVGPSKEAGLAPSDVIVELDGHPVHNNIMLRQYLYSNKKIGDEVKVTFYRNGKKETVTVKLGEQEVD
jgi:serine protease Do